MEKLGLETELSGLRIYTTAEEKGGYFRWS
jgi:hypothetical protein